MKALIKTINLVDSRDLGSYFKNELFGSARVPISEVPISEDLLYNYPAV